MTIILQIVAPTRPFPPPHPHTPHGTLLLTSWNCQLYRRTKLYLPGSGTVLSLFGSLLHTMYHTTTHGGRGDAAAIQTSGIPHKMDSRLGGLCTCAFFRSILVFADSVTTGGSPDLFITAEVCLGTRVDDGQVTLRSGCHCHHPRLLQQCRVQLEHEAIHAGGNCVLRPVGEHNATELRVVLANDCISFFLANNLDILRDDGGAALEETHLGHRHNRVSVCATPHDFVIWIEAEHAQPVAVLQNAAIVSLYLFAVTDAELVVVALRKVVKGRRRR
ncbi:hypothetical protein, conserved [Leishmania tarentolae]|uniref:Uncharacterized protein n=1 Tax=Leishmania tarentolae TaxID=5689 RepID=A0A640KSN1_LEITA|nr:hypothetical protein, conserved [Leishmania tarentolae]